MSENTDSLKPDVYIFSKEMKKQFEDLLAPAVHVCPACNQKIKGDIPFKMHALNCAAIAKTTSASAPPPPQKTPPATELVRILREKMIK